MITSTSNSQVKNILLLQNKSKARKKAGQFIVEGSKMVLEALSEHIIKVYVSESFLHNNIEIMKKLHIKLDSNQFEEVSDSVFVHMSDTQTPQGIMAVVSMNGSWTPYFHPIRNHLLYVYKIFKTLAILERLCEWQKEQAFQEL